MPDWKRTLAALWFAVFVTASGMWAMVPFLTYFVEELGVRDAAVRNLWTGVLVAAAPVVAAFMGPVWGGLGDRYSRKAMVLRGVGAITIFVGLMALVRTPWELLGLRILQGLFSGYVPPSITLVSVQAPLERQGRVAGLVQSAMHGGAVSGFALGGLIAGTGSMRSVFPICSALSLVGLLVVAFFVREGPLPERRSSERGPRAIFRGLSSDWRAAVALKPLMRLLAYVAVARLLVSSVNPSFARYVEALGGDKHDVGWLFSAEAAVLFAFTSIWGRVLESIGPRRVFAICACGLGVSFLGQAWASSYGELLGWRLVTGAAAGGVAPSCYAMAMRESAPHRRGSITGIVFMVLALAHSGGAALGGPLLNALGAEGLLLLVGVAACAMAALSFADARQNPDAVRMAGSYNAPRIHEVGGADRSGEPAPEGRGRAPGGGGEEAPRP